MNRRQAQQFLECADEIIEELEDELAAAKETKDAAREVLDGPFVQVKYLRGGVAYTYRDPSGTLEVGDLVEVPVSYGTKVGAVTKLGRGSYRGPVKTVLFKLKRQLI
jgi:hypothetical protein